MDGQCAPVVYQRHDLPKDDVAAALRLQGRLGCTGHVWQAFGNFHDAFFDLRWRQPGTGRELLPMPRLQFAKFVLAADFHGHLVGQIRIDHALARAGGPIYDEADLSALVIVRAAGEKIEVSLSEQFWRDVKDGNNNHYLYDGDVLYVPDAYKIEKVYVLGYVQNPGPQKVRGPMTPMQAIALAGGVKEEADIEKARIVRKNGSVQVVNLKQDKSRPLDNPEVLLYGGDTLEIPKRFLINWSLILSFISVASVAVGILMRN